MHPPESIIRKTIGLTSRATAWHDLRGFGTKVGNRVGKDVRTSDQREDFCVRHFLLGLTADLTLPYPNQISMLKQDQEGTWPDCVVRWGSGDDPVGLEITQATSAQWQRSLTQDERDQEDADEAVFVSASEDGWAGDSPEQETAALITDAINKKAEGLNQEIPKYRGTVQCDLLVYADDAAVIATGVNLNDRDTPLDTLMRIFELQHRSSFNRFERMFRRVDVLIGNWLIFSLLSHPCAVAVPQSKTRGLQ